MRKKILILDDDPDILEVLQLLLESTGYVALTLSNGEEAYKFVKEFQPEVIILDMLLSGKDGRIICKNLKNDDNTQHIPIIMISAHPDAPTTTIASGANDFLAKPFDIDDILEKIEKFFPNV